MTRLGGAPMLQAWEETVSALQWPLHSYLELGALPTAASCARLHAKHILHEWRVRGLADTVELLVSEITTNAVRAASVPLPPLGEATATGEATGEAAGDATAGEATAGVPIVRFWLASDRRRVLIQVWDSDHRRPTPQDAGDAAETGRGLLLVAKLSAQWGWYSPDAHGGKVVWALCASDQLPAL